MKILITGGAGFIGQRLAMECLKRQRLKLDNVEGPKIQDIVLADVAEPHQLIQCPVFSGLLRYRASDVDVLGTP